MKTAAVTSGQQGRVIATYYTNRARYDQKHEVSDLNASSPTMIIYAFVQPAESGEIELTDAWSDTYFRTEFSSNAMPPHVYGNFGDLIELKRKHRHIKVLISVAGWTLSKSLSGIAPSGEKRATFVKSCAQLVTDLGLDGIVIGKFIGLGLV